MTGLDDMTDPKLIAAWQKAYAKCVALALEHGIPLAEAIDLACLAADAAIEALYEDKKA